MINDLGINEGRLDHNEYNTSEDQTRASTYQYEPSLVTVPMMIIRKPSCEDDNDKSFKLVPLQPEKGERNDSNVIGIRQKHIIFHNEEVMKRNRLMQLCEANGLPMGHVYIRKRLSNASSKGGSLSKVNKHDNYTQTMTDSSITFRRVNGNEGDVRLRIDTIGQSDILFKEHINSLIRIQENYRKLMHYTPNKAKSVKDSIMMSELIRKSLKLKQKKRLIIKPQVSSLVNGGDNTTNKIKAIISTIHHTRNIKKQEQEHTANHKTNSIFKKNYINHSLNTHKQAKIPHKFSLKIPYKSQPNNQLASEEEIFSKRFKSSKQIEPVNSRNNPVNNPRHTSLSISNVQQISYLKEEYLSLHYDYSNQRLNSINETKHKNHSSIYNDDGYIPSYTQFNHHHKSPMSISTQLQPQYYLRQHEQTPISVSVSVSMKKDDLPYSPLNLKSYNDTYSRTQYDNGMTNGGSNANNYYYSHSSFMSNLSQDNPSKPMICTKDIKHKKEIYNRAFEKAVYNKREYRSTNGSLTESAFKELFHL